MFRPWRLVPQIPIHESRSKFLACRIFFRKTGIHFCGKCSRGVIRRTSPRAIVQTREVLCARRKWSHTSSLGERVSSSPTFSCVFGSLQRVSCISFICENIVNSAK
ncbi:hypothetical protein F1193_07640 [Blastochloris sulfoviridis]|uniref:Uncharacterized protein n=1 Tax=Blastochloris sulfoviridis TaxID=50712 RepID=A0A5M6I1F4_9HYPH|nr:hypothetical protein F1193_07640 [Blastochloris sulfoviridis]